MTPLRTVFFVLQEGGSTGEVYVTAFASREAALDYRLKAALASYRTSDVFEVPRRPALPELIELIETVAAAEFHYYEDGSTVE